MSLDFGIFPRSFCAGSSSPQISVIKLFTSHRKWQSPQISAILRKTSTKIAQKNNTKSWLAKFPNVDWLGQRLWPAVSRRPCASWLFVVFCVLFISLLFMLFYVLLVFVVVYARLVVFVLPRRDLFAGGGAGSRGHRTAPEDRARAHNRYSELLKLLDLCVAFLRRGHANLLCIVPNLTDAPRRESARTSYFNPRLQHRTHYNPPCNPSPAICHIRNRRVWGIRMRDRVDWSIPRSQIRCLMYAAWLRTAHVVLPASAALTLKGRPRPTVSGKKHSFRASTCPAVQQQKLQSSPWFGLLKAAFPACLLIRRSVFSHTGMSRGASSARRGRRRRRRPRSSSSRGPWEIWTVVLFVVTVYCFCPPGRFELSKGMSEWK